MENGVGSELCDDGSLRMEIDVESKKTSLGYTGIGAASAVRDL